METPTIPTNEVKKTSRDYHDTLDESIAKMKLAFSNASLPEIFAVMVTVGYTAEKIAALNTELTQLETLSQGQIKEFADQSEEQKKYTDKRNATNKVFIQHRALLRILFKGNVQAWVVLQLDEEIPKAIAAWTQLVGNFYAQLSNLPEISSAALTVGIDRVKIGNQKVALTDLETLKQNLRKEASEAQAATDARDAAFDALYPKYSEYIKFAKVLLPDNQALEAIGVKVTAN